jgi:pyruvate/2-oxoglutarate dehydrogenase complex dihydrolipoamide dehydrogenase (E3) component
MGVDCGPHESTSRACAPGRTRSARRRRAGSRCSTSGLRARPGEARSSTHDGARRRRELTADRILIATGSRTAVPPVPGIEQIEWIDHITRLELEQIPESLLVVGAGPVGLEFAQIFARFGSRVTIVNNGRQIAARADTEARDELQAALEDEGIEVVLGGGVDAFARDGDTTVATLPAVASSRVRTSCSPPGACRTPRTLGARRPASRRPRLRRRRRPAADERRRRSGRGDVAIGPQFTPTAQYQARIAIDDMFGVGNRAPTTPCFRRRSSPTRSSARSGSPSSEARDRGHDVDVVKHPASNVTRAQYTRTKHGLFKIVFDSARARCSACTSSRAGPATSSAASPPLSGWESPSTILHPCITSTRATRRA